jgi:hypothetical protein
MAEMSYSRARATQQQRLTHRPLLTAEWIRQNVPYQTRELIELFIEGLRKAGLED